MAHIKKIYFFIVIFVTCLNLKAGEFWLPATVQVGPDGEVTHTLPFPTTADHFETELVGDVGYGVWPITAGSYNKFKRIIALKPKNKKIKVESLKVDEEGVLQIADNKNGYLVIENKDWDIELGIGGVIFGSGSAMLFGGINISAGMGKTFVASRHVKRFEDIKKLKKPIIPKDMVDLRRWSEGDSLAWESRRNFAFAIEAGVGPFAVGATAMAGGHYSMELTRAEKKDSYDIIANFERVKEKGFNIYAGAFIGSVAYEKMKIFSSSFTFKFDLRKVKKFPVEFFPAKGFGKWKMRKRAMSAMEAYYELINGNLVVAQQLSKIKNSGVLKVEQTESKIKTKALKLGISIPFLISANFMKGKSFTISDTKYLNSNLVGESFIGVYNKELSTGGIFSRNLVRTRVFTGNFQRILDAKSNPIKLISQRYSGNYKYSYIRNKVSKKMLLYEFRRLRRKVGYTKEFNIKIPENDIGTVQLELDVRLSNFAVDELMNIAKKKKEEFFIQEGNKAVTDYFKTDPNAKEACRIQIKRPCRGFKILETKKYMKKAFKALKKMSQLKQENDYKNFVRVFADFGRGFIKNRFTLKAILHMTKTARRGPKGISPVAVNLSIQGTGISPYEKELPIY